MNFQQSSECVHTHVRRYFTCLAMKVEATHRLDFKYWAAFISESPSDPKGLLVLQHNEWGLSETSLLHHTLFRLDVAGTTTQGLKTVVFKVCRTCTELSKVNNISYTANTSGCLWTVVHAFQDGLLSPRLACVWCYQVKLKVDILISCQAS